MSGANITNLVIGLTVQRFVLLARAARQDAAGQLLVTDAQVPLG